MKKFAVLDLGPDTSGRTIWMTRYMQAWLDAVKADPKVAPFADQLVIVQGAFMLRNGGGASASAGYHDQAGCVDFRTWNLTTDSLDTFIRACRRRGGAAWRRDATHGGMDPHCHVTLGGDYPMTSGAKDSWASYVSGGDGLAGGGRDYEWRPTPLVTKFDYRAASTTTQQPPPPGDDDMQLSDDLTPDKAAKGTVGGALRRIDEIEAKLDKVLKLLQAKK